MFKNLSTLALGFSCPQYEQIELALSCGFEAISLNLVDYTRQVELRGQEGAGRLIQSARIKLGTWQLPVAIDGPDAQFEGDLAQLANRASIAAEIGCPRAVARIAAASDERPMHDNFELHRQRLSRIGRALEPHGVRLGLEFQAAPALRRDKAFEFISTQDALLKLIDTVGSGSVGLVLDVWQLYVSGGMIDDVRKLARDQIVAVQLADAPPDKDPSELANADRLLPGETGAIDSPAVLRHLAEIEYDGPVTPACSLARTSGQRRDAAIRAVGEALQRCWRAADLVTEQPLQSTLSRT
ncbi:MAG: sugar phosphate isomerase/epimerase [Planctomycetia bacterium]|nr:sugar phosphate isomerase/epimerase [Planctomycetia bacterium]